MEEMERVGRRHGFACIIIGRIPHNSPMGSCMSYNYVTKKSLNELSEYR